MSNIIDSISPGQGLSDAELLEILTKVRQGELSPEAAEQLLNSLPRVEADSSQQAPDYSQSVNQTAGYSTSAPLGQAERGTLIVDTLAADFMINSANQQIGLANPRLRPRGGSLQHHLAR